MQAFCFIFVAYFLFIYELLLIRYSSFYIRIERLFLLKAALTVKKIMPKEYFLFIGFENFLVNVWLILLLIWMDFLNMAVFFVAIYQAIFICKKIIAYSIVWWLLRIIILSSIIAFFIDNSGSLILRNLNWQTPFLFSLFFFLITFTTYLLKQLLYGKKSWQGISNIFKRS